MRSSRASVVALLLACALLGVDSCGPGRGAGRKKGPRKLTPLVYKQHSPNEVENSLAASGPAEGAINRDDRRFKDLVLNYNQDIIFKDEEGTAADRVMTQRCQEKLNTLAISVMNQWPGIRLRVTEGWDEEGHHSANSLHYEGRAVDITTSDKDRSKYGMLARLAKEAGFDWVYYESRNHIHCSVKSEPSHGKYGGCFAAHSTVETSTGETKKLKDLQVGERVLTMDLETKKPVFSEVLLFLDRDPGEVRNFVQLHMESGRTLTVTPSHLIVSVDNKNNTRTVFAATFDVGDEVLVRESEPEGASSDRWVLVKDRVSNVTRSFEIGVFAPLTRTGTVIVDGVVASCYATVDSQTIAHYAMAPVRIVHNLIEGFVRVWNLVSRPIEGWTNQETREQRSTPPVGVYWYAQVLYTIGDYVIPSRMFK